MAEADEESPLLKYLDELVDSLRGLVSPALKGQDVEAIHDARVATRRMKAAVDLLESIVSKRSRRPFNRTARSLRRQLGPLRDLDVMLEHLSSIKIARFSAAAAWMKERLVKCREKTSKRAIRKAPPARVLARLGTWWGLRQEIAEGQAAIDSLIAQSVHLQLDAFAERADEKGAGDPHALRIAGKSLRYTLEMAKEQGFSLPKGTTRWFKKMQDELGLWHDYVVMTERMLCETVDCDLALHNPGLQSQILGLAQWALLRAQTHMTKMNDLWKTKGEELCAGLRHAFPLTAPVAVPGPVELPQEPAPSAPAPESAAPAA